MLHLREYLGKNHEYAEFDRHIHQIETYFVCKIKSEHATESTNPDSHQVGIEWIAVKHLLEYRIYPKDSRKYIQEFDAGKRNRVYLGDIN